MLKLFWLFQKSPDGLYVCLYTFLGFGKKYVEKYASKTNRHLFLHIKHVKKPRNEVENSAQESGIPEKVSRMAIGVEGGFSADVKKDEFDEINQIVIIPSYQTFSIGKFFTKKNRQNDVYSRVFSNF